MAQSKKSLLKKIDRECRHLNPRVRYSAAQLRNHDLVDEFDLIWEEAYDLLREVQRVHPGDLQRSTDNLLPVTYQQVSQLHERLQTFTQRMPSSR
jgi:hypothetical protein